MPPVIIGHGSANTSCTITDPPPFPHTTLGLPPRLVLLVFLPPHSPQVTFCGYSIPHPTEDSVNIRVQTTGEPGPLWRSSKPKT